MVKNESITVNAANRILFIITPPCWIRFSLMCPSMYGVRCTVRHMNYKPYWQIDHSRNDQCAAGLRNCIAVTSFWLHCSVNAIDGWIPRYNIAPGAQFQVMEDGRVPIDNNRTEDAIRSVAVWRNNWLFAGSLRAGQRMATAGGGEDERTGAVRLVARCADAATVVAEPSAG